MKQYKHFNDRAEKERLKRLYNRILSMLKTDKDNCLFITFTFTNKTLEKTNEETRLRYIKQYLNSQCNDYILNKDYGKTTEREHYHAIATPNKNYILKIDEINHYYGIKYNTYKLGQIKAEIITKMGKYRFANDSIEKIAQRLTEHATKESTKHNKIIYSRHKKYLINKPFKAKS